MTVETSYAAIEQGEKEAVREMSYGMLIEKKGLVGPFFLHQPSLSLIIIQLFGVSILNLGNQPGCILGKITAIRD